MAHRPDAPPPPTLAQGDVRLERAQPADVDALFTLIDESFAPLLGPAGQWNRDGERGIFRRSFKPDQDRVLRRTSNHAASSTIEGLWSVRRVSGGLVLLYAVLAPDWRNRGIGSWLLSTLMAEADVNGVPLELTVHRLNRARELYQRVGFQTVLETDTKLRMRYSPNLEQ